MRWLLLFCVVAPTMMVLFVVATFALCCPCLICCDPDMFWLTPGLWFMPNLSTPPLLYPSSFYQTSSLALPPLALFSFLVTLPSFYHPSSTFPSFLTSFPLSPLFNLFSSTFSFLRSYLHPPSPPAPFYPIFLPPTRCRACRKDGRMDGRFFEL